jgi:hypothetical protein
MEMSQGNSLYSYFKQTKMSFCKNREQEGKNSSCLQLVPVEAGGIEGKGVRGEYGGILCTHV